MKFLNTLLNTGELYLGSGGGRVKKKSVKAKHNFKYLQKAGGT